MSVKFEFDNFDESGKIEFNTFDGEDLSEENAIEVDLGKETMAQFAEKRHASDDDEEDDDELDFHDYCEPYMKFNLDLPN